MKYEKAKSLKQLKSHPLVADIWIEETDMDLGNDYWVYLKKGFFNSSDGSHQFHEYGVRDTLREFNKWVEICECNECNH